VAFDVLLQLFDEVQYSLEEILVGQSDGVMCFDRVILGGLYRRPYYSNTGRFGVDDRWKGVLPEIRDWVNSVHGINVTRTQLRSTTTTKPHLTFIDRPCAEWSTRCLYNTADVMRYLSNRFDVTLLSFNSEENRFEKLIKMLQQMTDTDILVGMHGAGLAHAVFLQSGTLLVEIKDGTVREKKLFLNMANKQDIGYYLYDALPASINQPHTILSNEEMEHLTEDLWSAWKQEQEYSQIQNNSNLMLMVECLFPEFLSKSQSMLSTFNVSRCYLEQSVEHSNKWCQCTHYKDCSFR
jgi:Glycosyltransferase 61